LIHFGITGLQFLFLVCICNFTFGVDYENLRFRDSNSGIALFVSVTISKSRKKRRILGEKTPDIRQSLNFKYVWFSFNNFSAKTLRQSIMRLYYRPIRQGYVILLNTKDLLFSSFSLPDGSRREVHDFETLTYYPLEQFC